MRILLPSMAARARRGTEQSERIVGAQVMRRQQELLLKIMITSRVTWSHHSGAVVVIKIGKVIHSYCWHYVCQSLPLDQAAAQAGVILHS